MTTPVQQAIESLRGEFGTRISTGTAVRDQHGRGEAFAQGHLRLVPEAVLRHRCVGGRVFDVPALHR